jgi:short-subunit dehydrogenase
MKKFELKIPWHPVQEEGTGICDQFYKEVGHGHLLFGKEVQALARRQDCDDVLFKITGEETSFAIVHLTWSQNKQSDPKWPSTDFFSSADELQLVINKDAKEWDADEKEYYSGLKKVIVIGATSGIGKRLAEIYAGQGWQVGVTGRRKELLEQISNKYPQQIQYECFDVTKNEPVTHLEKLIANLAGLDLLIISAGNGEPSEELDWSIDKTTIDTNVNGFAALANYGFNYFVKQGHGQLAVISSVSANRGGSHAPAYNASKAFQSSYFEGLSIKAKKMKKNIAVTCIEPGFVDTKMAKGDGIFWLVPVDKAARQIIAGIEKRKRKVYISKRWRLIAWLMRNMPYWVYKRIG